MDIPAETLALLAIVGLVAGFIDSVAGGGGLLALPSLLLAGLDPVSALATNKLQGTFGTASATHAFWRKGILKPQDHVPEIGTAFAGAVAGVIAVNYVSTDVLHAVMPVLLVLVAGYFAFAPILSVYGSTPKFPVVAFVFGFAPLIAFYDGIFGPGTGSFFMLVLVGLFGHGVLEATARTKLLNFTSNIAALLVFIVVGQVFWVVGLGMGAAQVIGAQIGARVAIANGAKVIRPLLVIMCVAMAIRLYMKA
jgi:uncharacterized protein